MRMFTRTVFQRATIRHFYGDGGRDLHGSLGQRVYGNANPDFIQPEPWPLDWRAVQSTSPAVAVMVAMTIGFQPLPERSVVEHPL